MLVSSLTEKIAALEVRIQSLERVSESESSVVSVGESLDALGGVSNPPTPALEPSQRGEWVTTRRHNRKAKANAKARPQEHHSFPLHVSNRFALLSEAPAEKPERALVIGDSILRHVKLARPLGAPAALVRCIPGARAPDIAVSSLTEKIAALEVRIQSLERVSESESSVVSVGESLDALGGVSNPPTPALEPSQRGEWVTTRRHNRKAKANAKARPQEHHSSPLHVSNRFALLSEAPAEKPERALVIGDSILRHVKLARPLGAPAALVRCIPGARAPDIAAELSGLLFIGDGILQDTLSCSSWPMSPALRWEKRWVDLRLIPLLHARLSQYVPGSDICRQNAFQVIAVDGVCSGIIQCPSAEECTDWLQAIASNISALTKHNVKKINRNFPVNQQIIYMGWVDEKEQDSVQDRMYTPKFLALRGSSLFKFSAPPVTTWDWTRAEQSFTVYEIMCKILKDSELLDKRRQCFSVQMDTGEDAVFSVELESDLVLWEKAFQMATFLEVERIQSKTYACITESHLMGLTIDFSMGFICFDAASKVVLWRYKFSQLKGSSDDGKSKIKFLFQNPDTKLIEAKELEFSNLFAVLHCIHAFFAAKVACLDPMFVGSPNSAAATAVPTLTSVTSLGQAARLKYLS
ncbi:hypothetical protein PGIGA_G00004800 [Pangasianodon gigas]|uniref:Uncharacterized protein n=1 Tax=Pangasianodon gigas TaxID=30993 RepID=A0ACC5W648_PANGG|nr:hypothetical protein [Pangasianodon gigas]